MKAAVILACLAGAVGFGCAGDEGNPHEQIMDNYCEALTTNFEGSQVWLREYRDAAGLTTEEAVDDLLDHCYDGS